MRDVAGGVNLFSCFLALWAWSRFVRVLPVARPELWDSIGRPEPGFFGWRKGMSLKGVVYIMSRRYRGSGDARLVRWGATVFLSLLTWIVTFLFLAFADLTPR